MTNQLDAQEFEKEILSIFINEIRRRIIVCIDKNCDFSAVYSLSNELSKLVAFVIVESIFIDYFKELIKEKSKSFIGQGDVIEGEEYIIGKESNDKKFSAYFHTSTGIKIYRRDQSEPLDMESSGFGKGIDQEAIIFEFGPDNDSFFMSDGNDVEVWNLSSLKQKMDADILQAWAFLVDSQFPSDVDHQAMIGALKNITIEQAILICSVYILYKKTKQSFILIPYSLSTNHFNQLKQIVKNFLQNKKWVMVLPEKSVDQRNGKGKDASQWKKFWENVSVAGVGIAAAVGAYRLYQYMTQSEK